jgi:fructose-specific phosphotransferase system IIC component
MWLFATAWDSPNRHIILGTTMTLPLLIAIGVFIVIRLNWKKQPLFSKSMVQIENDWHVFKNGLDGTADTSDEANR